MSGENSSDNIEERDDDAAKAAAFLDIDGRSSSTADDDSAAQAAAAFLETESVSESADEDTSTEAATAFLKPDSGDDSDEPAPTMPDIEPESAPAATPVADGDVEDDEYRPSIELNTPPDDGIERRWYAIHAHSGQEATVQRALTTQAEIDGLSDLITNVLVPMEEISEFKSGEKKISKRKYFPGYLLLQLPLHPERYADLWHLIKDTTGVTGFIGSRNEPVPLEDSEVSNLVEEIRGERERPYTKINFDVGERIKIIDGAFANFFGNISEINEERGKMKIMIEIFERQTSVEVEFWQVEKN